MPVLAGGLRRAVRRAVRRAQVRTVLLSPLSGGALGLSAVLAAAAYVAQVRGLMAPGAWMAGLGAGVLWVVVAALVPRPMDDEMARGVLLAAFGADVGRHPETARPVRALIEPRLRLAEAVARHPVGTRIEAGIEAGIEARIEAGVDGQIARLVPVAQKAAQHRLGLQFHAAMASAAGQRLDGHNLKGRGPEGHGPEGRGLEGQRAATGDMARHAEAARVALEQEVAAVSALVARVTLALVQGDQAAIAALADEAGRLTVQALPG